MVDRQCQSLPAPQCLTLPKCKVPPAHMLARCCQRLLCLQPPLPQAPALPHLLGVASTSLGQSLPAGSCQSLLAPQCFTLPRYPALLAHRLACCRQCLFCPEPPLPQAPALPHLLGIASASLRQTLPAGSCQLLLAPQCLTLPHYHALPARVPACCFLWLFRPEPPLPQAPALPHLLGIASASLDQSLPVGLCQSLQTAQALTLPHCQAWPAHVLACCSPCLFCPEPPLPQAPALPHLLGIASASLGQSLSAGSCQSLLAPQCLTLQKYRALPAHMLACCCQCLFCPEPPLPQAPALPHLLGDASAILGQCLPASSCQPSLASQCQTFSQCQALPVHTLACLCRCLPGSEPPLPQAPALPHELGIASSCLCQCFAVGLCQSLLAPQCLTLPQCPAVPVHSLAHGCQCLSCFWMLLRQAPALPHWLGIVTAGLSRPLPAGSCQSLLAPQCFKLPRRCQCLCYSGLLPCQAPALPHWPGITTANFCGLLCVGPCQSLLAPQCLTLPHRQAPPGHLPACCCQSLSCSWVLFHQAPALPRVLGIASLSLCQPVPAGARQSWLAPQCFTLPQCPSTGGMPCINTAGGSAPPLGSSAVQSGFRRTQAVCHHASSATQLLGTVSGNVSAPGTPALQSGCYRTRKVCPHASRGTATGGMPSIGAAIGNVSAFGSSALQSSLQPCSLAVTVLTKCVLTPLEVCQTLIQQGPMCQRLGLQPCGWAFAVNEQYVITPLVLRSFWVLSVATCQRLGLQPCSQAVTVLAKCVLTPLEVCRALIQLGALCQRLGLQPCSRAFAVLKQFVITPLVLRSFWVVSVTTCQGLGL